MPIPDIMLRNKELYGQCAREFEEIFGCKLFDYFDYVTGFDLIAFDEKKLKVPDGISCKAFVKKKYDAAGVEMILRLIGN